MVRPSKEDATEGRSWLFVRNYFFFSESYERRKVRRERERGGERKKRQEAGKERERERESAVSSWRCHDD